MAGRGAGRGQSAGALRPNRTVTGLRLYSVEVFVRRDGRWQILQSQGTPLQPERTWIDLPPAALDAFAWVGGREGRAARVE